jgi:hypothetical protein
VNPPIEYNHSHVQSFRDFAAFSRRERERTVATETGNLLESLCGRMSKHANANASITDSASVDA